MHRLWYVLRGGEVTGPYPRAAMDQDLLLGRLHHLDLVSPDRERWAPLDTWPELGTPQAAEPSSDDQWQAERNSARLRWADQRRELGRAGWARRALGSTAPGPALSWRIALLVGLILALALVLAAQQVGLVNPVTVRLF